LFHINNFGSTVIRLTGNGIGAENKYNRVKVRNSRQSQKKAPDKDELEMILRTGKASNKLLLQEKVKYALNHSITMRQFISNPEKQNINVLFNQASTAGYLESLI